MAKKIDKNLTAAIGVLAVAIAASGAFYAWKNYEKRDAGDFVVAQVNGKDVYASEANAQLQKISKGAAPAAEFTNLNEQAKNIVLKELAAQRKILKDAYKSGVESNDAVKEKVSKFKDEVVKDEFLSEMAKESVTEDKIKEHYNELAKGLEGKTQYKVKHILLKTENEAKSARNAAITSSFEKVAKKRSIDSQTALTGGDLGYLVGGNMLPQIEEAVSKIKVGSISKPVKTQFGWHVLKLEEKGPAAAADFEVVKAAIARDLYQQTIKEYVKNVVDNAEIKILESASMDVKEEAAEAKPEQNPAAVPAEAAGNESDNQANQE
jgi:peptidyl-prolyl cis-trans isomerase C